MLKTHLHFWFKWKCVDFAGAAAGGSQGSDNPGDDRHGQQVRANRQGPAMVSGTRQARSPQPVRHAGFHILLRWGQPDQGLYIRA